MVVHAAVNSNTYAVYGHGQEKDLTELVPNILSQLGPESMDSLKRLAEQVGSQGRSAQKEQEPDDDDVPVRISSSEGLRYRLTRLCAPRTWSSPSTMLQKERTQLPLRQARASWKSSSKRSLMVSGQCQHLATKACKQSVGPRETGSWGLRLWLPSRRMLSDGLQQAYE